MNFHLNTADRSKCPIRKDFNSLYIKYCQRKFGRNSAVESRNSAEMFDKLDERINEFIESIEYVKISYQLYNKDQNSELILEIVTPLKQRLHSKVIDTLNFH